MSSILSVACKGDEEASAATEEATKAIEAQAEISEEEDELLARRDALLNSRQELREERAALDARIREVREQGGDTTELEQEFDALEQKEEELGSAESELNSKLDELIGQRRALMSAIASAGAGEEGAVAAREAGIAAREREIAARESKVAAREAAMAERERKLAVRENEMCGGAVQPQTVIQTIDVKGSKYTKKDVEPLLRRARREMSRKGILASDLPPQAQGLEREATNAMGEGDYGKARFAATQLLATVRSTRIDKGFIAAKIARLNAVMKGKELPDGKRREVDNLFRSATANYGDGRFGRANQKLNRIYAAIR